MSAAFHHLEMAHEQGYWIHSKEIGATQGLSAAPSLWEGDVAADTQTNELLRLPGRFKMPKGNKYVTATGLYDTGASKTFRVSVSPRRWVGNFDLVHGL